MCVELCVVPRLLWKKYRESDRKIVHKGGDPRLEDLPLPVHTESVER